MQLTTTVVGLAAFVAYASAHGIVRSPAIRTPGAATAAVCGQAMVDFYNADNTSYPEAFLRTGNTPLNPALCNMWLCKGFQWEDNQDRILRTGPGAVIPIEVFIRIPHVGYANVSIVDTTTNTVIGEPLISWPSGYADGALYPNLPANQTNFSVTIPELSPRCTVPGSCVIQWYWFGQGQTYESCIDFQVPIVDPPPTWTTVTVPSTTSKPPISTATFTPTTTSTRSTATIATPPIPPTTTAWLPQSCWVGSSWRPCPAGLRCVCQSKWYCFCMP